MTFYVYEDWTTETIPRCFYAGKGSLSRVRNVKRNRKHTWVKRHFGFDRRIVIETTSEQWAYHWEIRRIAELHLHVRDEHVDIEVACNFTKGGEGLPHELSDETRVALGWMRGKRHHDATKAKISASLTGRVHPVMSQEARDKISTAHLGRKLSDEHRQKISDSGKGRTPWCKGRRGVKTSDPGHVPWNKGLAREDNPNTGTKRSPEARERMRQAALARERRKRDDLVTD